MYCVGLAPFARLQGIDIGWVHVTVAFSLKCSLRGNGVGVAQVNSVSGAVGKLV